MGKEMQRLGDLLSEVGARVGIDRAAEAGALWSRWDEIVGDAIAAHAEPTSFKRGVLKIRAESATWATEIGYLREHIMRAANAALGGSPVTEVQVWTGPGPIRRRRATTGSTDARAVSGTRPSEVRAEDPEEALTRARAAWLRRRSGGSSTVAAKTSRKAPDEALGKPENPW